jgi:hypothetical protein
MADMINDDLLMNGLECESCQCGWCQTEDCDGLCSKCPGYPPIGLCEKFRRAE